MFSLHVSRFQTVSPAPLSTFEEEEESFDMRIIRVGLQVAYASQSGKTNELRNFSQSLSRTPELFIFGSEYSTA